jgi:hypothetical protein
MVSFRGEPIDHQHQQIIGLVLLIAVIGAVIGATIWLGLMRTSGQQQVLTGQVLRFGNYTNKPQYHRLVLVRVPDGSTHQIVVQRDLASQCRAGDRIAIYPVGKTYRANVIGCSIDQRPKP